MAKASESALDVVVRLYETARAKDRKAHDALIANDCVLYEPDSHPHSQNAGVSRWQGRDAVAMAISLVKQYSRSTGYELLSLLTDGRERVVCLYNLLGVDSNGQSYSMPMAESFRVINGKVVEIRPYYWDMCRMRKIVGVD